MSWLGSLFNVLVPAYSTAHLVTIPNKHMRWLYFCLKVVVLAFVGVRIMLYQQYCRFEVPRGNYNVWVDARGKTLDFLFGPSVVVTRAVMNLHFL